MGIIARQSIKGTIVTYLGVFVGFLTTFFVLTRFLQPEEIGLARVLVNTATLFIGLAQLGTSSSIIRFFPYFKDMSGNPKVRQHNGFFFWTIVIPLFGFCLFALLYWLFSDSICSQFADKSPLFVTYYYAVLPMAFFMLYQTIFETNANVLMRIVVPRMVRELFLRIFLLATYLLYAFRVISMDGFVIALCLCYGLCAVCNIIYLFAYGHISLRPDFRYVDRQLAKEYGLYTLFQITAAITTAITPTLSEFFITSKLGLEYNGIFAIATYMAAMVSIPNRSLNSIANPQLAQTTKDGDQAGLTKLLKQLANNSFFVGSFILAVIWINMDLIFRILPNGATYESARYVVLLLGLTQLLMATFNATTSVLSFSRYYYLSLLYSILLTIASLMLNNWLIPLWGMNGAAMANLLAYTFYFGGMCLTMHFACKTSPFSLSQGKTLLLIGLLVALCTAFDWLLPGINVWVGSLIKTALWGMALLVAFRWKISPEVSALILNYLPGKKK